MVAAGAPRVLVLDEPTQGVDIGAKATIHRLIAGAAAKGLAVLVVGDDAEELVEICHRVVVLRDGRAALELGGSDLTRERLVATIVATGTASA